MHRTGQPQHIWNTLALAFADSVPRARFPFALPRKSIKTHQGLCPLRLRPRHGFGAQAQCAMRFASCCLCLAHPRQILTQSFKDKSTRPVAGAAELFYAKALVALPFSSGFPPSFALLLVWLHCNIHTLLVAARCRHSLRHRFPAGLHYAL